MIPPQCDYHRAGSVDEALDLLDRHGDRDAALLAGGHGLVPDMKTGVERPDVLVDIRDVPDLGSVQVVDDGDAVRIGALVTHASLASAETLDSEARVLSEAAANVADVQIRNRGTIGGNLAEADPRADLPPAVLAAGATLDVRGPDGFRSVDAAEFFRGDGRTALDSGEVLTHVRVPTGDDVGAYVRKTHPASGYAMVSVAVRLATVDGTVTDARVVAGGLTDRPVRLSPVENTIVDSPADGAARTAAAEQASAELDEGALRGDALASAEYRRGILPAYVERALRTALARARGDSDE